MQLHGCSCLRHSYVFAGDIRLYRRGSIRHLTTLRYEGETKHMGDEYVIITHANTAIPARLGFRSNQVALQRFFDLSQSYIAIIAGTRLGSAKGPATLRLNLTIGQMNSARRHHLNLPCRSVVWTFWRHTSSLKNLAPRAVFCFDFLKMKTKHD